MPPWIDEWYEIIMAVLIVLLAAGLGFWVGWDRAMHALKRGMWAKGYAEGVEAEKQRQRLREAQQTEKGRE